MNKSDLQQILSTAYSLATWRQVLTEVFGVRNLQQQPADITARLSGGDDKLAERAFELGSFETADGRLVGLYQVDLKKEVRIGQNRVGVRSLLRNIYKYDVDAALVVFVQGDRWRLSLISEIRVLDADGSLTDQKTEPKRFTYLLGIGETVRTAVDRLSGYRESDASLKSLIDTFSVEPLNKAFFKEYRENVFNTIVAEVQSSFADVEGARLFTQRLLNRLMFLYFIQKKGWMHFEGDRNYLRRVFDVSIAKGENFYRDRLYWIFFYGLSHHAESIEVKDDPFLQDKRGHVAYLNGGLFEMEADGTDEKGKIPISNERFADVLRLFESYNFTIDESTPFDVQVAVDPEMLGKVFEELVTGRHESGSYYTPRTVVSFMCREALKHALADSDTPEAIAKLVDENDGKDVKDPEKILKRLRSIKACDPACGSGAYLLGMLQELLHVREALFAATDVAKDAQYHWKREIIENSIYGVDLDRFATQIAALRLWLSLAIESDEPHPLPNLKYKIGCGDSLLAPIETVGQGDLHRRALIEQFRARKREYTDADDHLRKSEIEVEIERLRVEIARTLQHLPEPPSDAKLILARNSVEPLRAEVLKAVRERDKSLAESKQKKLDALLADIAKWEAERSVDHYDTGDIFDWSVEFAEVFEDGGFDVVLANPPYVRQEEIKGLKPALKKRYSTFAGTADLYVYFYERGWHLLKPGGALAFITQNKFFRAAYGENLRRFLSSKTALKQVIDFGDAPIFDATAYPCIVMCVKTDPGIQSSLKALKWRSRDSISEFASEFRTRNFPVAQAEFTADGWRLESPEVLALLKKLRAIGVPLGEYVDRKIYRGIITGLNEAFVINGETRDRLVSRHPSSSELLKPFLRGRDVKRWKCEFADRYLIKIESSSNKKHPWSGKPVEEAEAIFAKTYPAIHAHLNEYREALIRRDDQGAYFWELRACAYWSEFEKPKIIYPDIYAKQSFGWQMDPCISANTSYFIPVNEKWLVALLNSAAVEWFYSLISNRVRGGYLRAFTDYVSQIPIPNVEAETQTELTRLVNEIETNQLDTMDRISNECKIDQVVYKLYKLNSEELTIIQGGI